MNSPSQNRTAQGSRSASGLCAALLLWVMASACGDTEKHAEKPGKPDSEILLKGSYELVWNSVDSLPIFHFDHNGKMVKVGPGMGENCDNIHHFSTDSSYLMLRTQKQPQNGRDSVYLDAISVPSNSVQLSKVIDLSNPHRKAYFLYGVDDQSLYFIGTEDVEYTCMHGSGPKGARQPSIPDSARLSNIYSYKIDSAGIILHMQNDSLLIFTRQVPGRSVSFSY